MDLRRISAACPSSSMATTSRGTASFSRAASGMALGVGGAGWETLLTSCIGGSEWEHEEAEAEAATGCSPSSLQRREPLRGRTRRSAAGCEVSELGTGERRPGMEREIAEVEEEEEVACECCGFTEECTAPYIAGVRARYGGRWICGLCGDAVGEELGRASPPISPAEALDRHACVCRRASAPPSPAGSPDDLIAALRLLLRRRLGSPAPLPSRRRARSTPNGGGRIEGGGEGRELGPLGGRGRGRRREGGDGEAVVGGEALLSAPS